MKGYANFWEDLFDCGIYLHFGRVSFRTDMTNSCQADFTYSNFNPWPPRAWTWIYIYKSIVHQETENTSCWKSWDVPYGWYMYIYILLRSPPKNLTHRYRAPQCPRCSQELPFFQNRTSIESQKKDQGTGIKKTTMNSWFLMVPAFKWHGSYKYVYCTSSNFQFKHDAKYHSLDVDHCIYFKKHTHTPILDKLRFLFHILNSSEPRKKTYYFPLYWLVYRDPYNGLL